MYRSDYVQDVSTERCMRKGWTFIANSGTMLHVPSRLATKEAVLKTDYRAILMLKHSSICKCNCCFMV